MATITDNTGWIPAGRVKQYTTNVNSGTCYSFTNLDNAKVIDGKYAHIPTSGGVNNTHRSPRLYFDNFNFYLPNYPDFKITRIGIRRHVQTLHRDRKTGKGNIKDEAVMLKNYNSIIIGSPGIGNNRASNSNSADGNWAYGSFKRRDNVVSTALWGVPNITRGNVHNNPDFGCIIQCIGTTTDWCTPAIDGVEMYIEYTYKANPIYTHIIDWVPDTIHKDDYVYPVVSHRNIGNGAGVIPPSKISGSGAVITEKQTELPRGRVINPGERVEFRLTDKSLLAEEEGQGTIILSTVGLADATKNVTVTKKPNIPIIITDFKCDWGGITNGKLLMSGETRNLKFTITGTSDPRDSFVFSFDHGNIPFSNVEWNFDGSSGVGITPVSVSKSMINFTITKTGTQRGDFTAVVNVEIKIPPIFSRNTLWARHNIDNKLCDVYYDVALSINSTFKHGVKRDSFRVTSSTGDFFECVGEAYAAISECAIIQEIDTPFIGVVNLDKPGHSPDGLYNKTTNTLIKEGYKNRINIGKKGDYHETIPLKVNVPYHKASAFQGMVDMDKPFPINTVLHRPDMDPFNHRGWVEIYGANLKYLNNHRTTVELDVEYISRNLSVPTTITRYNPLNPTLTSNMADLILEQFNIDYSDAKEGGKAIKINIDPDTGEMESYQPTFVTGGSGNIKDNSTVVLDELDFYRYKTSEALAEKVEIEFYWKVDFDKTAVDKVLTSRPADNYVAPDSLTYNIEREITLVDGNDKTIFSYMLDNVVYEIDKDEKGEVLSESLSANVVLQEFYEDGSSEEYSNEVDFIFGKIEDGESNQWGLNSITTFKLENDTVTVSETGTSGKLNEGSLAYQSEEIHTIPADKTFILENRNMSEELETDWDDILGPVKTDFQTVFNVYEYTNMGDISNFSNMIVSPFPLLDKPFLFFRRCKDGLLYYYIYDGGTPSTYYIQPNNMYKGGTNLTTETGSPILTDRYTVNPLCMDNGLVRCIFMKNLNRVGIYLLDLKRLGKPDPWNLITAINVSNMGSISVSKMDDDSITINAGGTDWTIYRGHFNIDIVHKNNKLSFFSRFDRIKWFDQHGEYVDDKIEGNNFYPFTNSFYHEFYNTTEKKDGMYVEHSEGLMVIRPYMEPLGSEIISPSPKTVLIPFYESSKIHNRPSSLFLEWVYQYQQSIVAKGL